MKWGMLLFLLLPILGHMYVFWRIWQILPLGGWYKAALISCLLMGLISLVVIFTAGLDRWPLPLARIIYEAGTSWLFILLYLFMLFALLDLGRLTHLVKPSFLQSSAAGSLTVALLISAIFLYGNINYQHKVRRHITIDSEGKVKKPVKVVLLSDLHLGYHNTREDLQKWVRIVNNEQADAVLIAGVPDGLDNVQMILGHGVGHVGRAFGIVPQAEAVVMFGGEDDFLETVFRCHPYPLRRIQRARGVIVQNKLLAPGFAVQAGVFSVKAGEGGLAKVVEHDHLPLLPFQLRLGRASPVRRRGAYGVARDS